VTIGFTVAGGRATNRTVLAATPPSNGGVDECLVRAFAEVTTPDGDATDIQYSLAFDPRAPP
jgi:hypothetical protein